MKTNLKSKVLTNESDSVKSRGKIYTPSFLVDVILNQCKYVDGFINKKHVMENSCGNGQFLVSIVERYINDFFKKSSDLAKLKNELETFIHAIELDEIELDVCKTRCDEVASKYGIKSVEWDFLNGDTLYIDRFDNKMDFVIGNPPYVRVHNLNDNFVPVKQHKFSNCGMTDLYITFYELGLKMLNEKGILSYITPSSFFTSLAGKNMRKYLIDNNLIESICDLKHFQPFAATTYTTIVCLCKNSFNKPMNYFEFDKENKQPIFVDKLNKEDYYINGNFYFSNKSNLELLRKILYNSKKTDICIKNGFATLNDGVFIGDFDFESKYIIPIIKASRAKWTKIIYPYNQKGDLVSEEELKLDNKLYTYLKSNKKDLLNRSLEKNEEKYWYAFGRSQGLRDTYKDKISINTLIRTGRDLKIVDVPSGSGVYSGLYIISRDFSSAEIRNSLLDNEFELFVSLLGKYKNGGCYTFSTKDVKMYLNYKLGV